jgi:SAM-dependent methyltransferase
MNIVENCPLCKSNELATYAMKYSAGFPHLSRTICKKCNLVFANPMATKQELNHFYANYYEKGNFEALEYKNKTTQLFNDIDNSSKDQLIQFDPNVSQYAQQGTFLDIGFGLGFQLYLANKCGANEIHGTELDADAIQFVQQHLGNAQLFHGELFAASYPENYFDTINLCHVIEHVIDPVDYMHEVYRITKKGGVLILSTPNIHALPYKIFRTLNFFSGKVPLIVDGLEHTVIFNKNNLRLLAEQVGFKVVHQYSESVNDSFKNIFNSNLSFKKKVVRYVQTKLKINQVLVLTK